MSAVGNELPMAPAECTLDSSRLEDQLRRYQQLGATANSIEQQELKLVISFSARVDLGLLDETVEIERQCCSFFSLDYDASRRVLSIAVAGPERRDALAALLSALTSGLSGSISRSRC
jgi:cobalamin biosynthesis Mg chelatase CobN